MIRLLYKPLNRISSSLNILILSPSYRAVGDCSEAIFFGLLHCIDKDKKLLLIKPFESIFFKQVAISNKYLYQLDHDLLIKPHFLINFIFSFLMTVKVGLHFIRSKFRKLLAKIFNLPKKFIINIEESYKGRVYLGINYLYGFSEEQIYGKKEWMELEKKYNPPDIPISIKESCKEFIESNIPEAMQKKWVTLHVTDNANNEARGANIMNYTLAIKYLISKGFHIFRIGDRTMPKAPDLKGVTDLAHIDHNNSLDLFLIQNSEFHLGVQSGPSYLSHLFKKDLLITNLVEWSTALPRKKGNFFIMKKFFYKSNKKRIPISDLLKKEFNFQINTNSCEDRNIYIEENSSADILTALKDFLKYKESDENYTEAQRNFDKKKNLWLKKELLQEDLKIHYAPKNHYDLQRKRSIALSTVSGTMANSFLEENWK